MRPLPGARHRQLVYLISTGQNWLPGLCTFQAPFGDIIISKERSAGGSKSVAETQAGQPELRLGKSSQQSQSRCQLEIQKQQIIKTRILVAPSNSRTNPYSASLLNLLIMRVPVQLSAGSPGQAGEFWSNLLLWSLSSVSASDA